MASEYLKWKYRDVKPDTPVELTKQQRRRNWWHYHKWHVGIGVVLVLIVCNLVWSALTQVRPDYQIAYVGEFPLSEEEAAAWEARLTALGADCNGDGKVIVQLNQYPTGEGGGEPMYAYAYNMKLMADLDSCDSYFFLLEDPELFQTGYEILREDWFPVENGLTLARRAFWQDETPKGMEGCDALWAELRKEANP